MTKLNYVILAGLVMSMGIGCTSETKEEAPPVPAVGGPAVADAAANADPKAKVDEDEGKMIEGEPAAAVAKAAPDADLKAAADAAEDGEPVAPALPAPKDATVGSADAPAPVKPADPPAKADPAAAAAQDGTKTVRSGDWPMWGGTPGRNMVNKTTGITFDFEIDPENEANNKNVLWSASLGSQTYANQVVANGMVIVGTNNGAEKRPKHKGDRGCLMAFEAKTGKFMWQLTREKLPDGRVNDWPEQGICSTPCVEGDRIYVVTNRCELMCVDAKGFYDDENASPYTEEVDKEKQDADIIWSLDMLNDLGVFPHNLATSSPVIHGDNIFIVTSNGVDEAHKEIPSPRAPSFIAVNKISGKVVWENNEPFDTILHGQWSSPAIGIVNGKAQVYMPGGDGWLYAFDCETGKIVWKFDLNPKDSFWELGGAGTRNAIIATPVFIGQKEGKTKTPSVILAVGQDPEHAEGVGHIYRIDATKTGDVSPRIKDGKGFKANPNSGQIWHFGGLDKTGEVTGEVDGLVFRRTLSTVSVHEGLVYAADLSGFVHCLDFKTGKRYWQHDTFSGIWGSTLVVDGKVLIGDEDGEMTILKAGKREVKLGEKVFNSSVYSTPTIANGVLYVTDRSRLYAIKITK